MTVICQDCARFNLRDSHIGHLEFGICQVKSLHKGHTFGATYPRECTTFTPASPETIAKREAALKEAE